MLFENKPRENANDPFMINLKGIRVRVQEEQVAGLLAKGFKLEDPSWRITSEIEKRMQAKDIPLPRAELEEKVSEELDMLEVTEI